MLNLTPARGVVSPSDGRLGRNEEAIDVDDLKAALADYAGGSLTSR